MSRAKQWWCSRCAAEDHDYCAGRLSTGQVCLCSHADRVSAEVAKLRGEIERLRAERDAFQQVGDHYLTAYEQDRRRDRRRHPLAYLRAWWVVRRDVRAAKEAGDYVVENLSESLRYLAGKCCAESGNHTDAYEPGCCGGNALEAEE